MKKVLLLLFVLVFAAGCDKDGDSSDNPYLPNYAFNVEINRSLPLYSTLNFAGNAKRVDIAGAGIRGLLIVNTGTGILAFDGACPNQELGSCSTLTLNGVEATCPCDSAVYNLYTGQSPGKPYPLKQYRTEVIGSVIRVYN